MKAVMLGALMACVPAVASALSCMPHSVEAAFNQAQAADERYIVVHGRLDFDAGKLPKVDYNNQQATPTMTLIKGELVGSSLSAGGFTIPFRKDVTIAVACFGPWCASAKKGSDVIAFVEQGAEGHVISTNPCGGYLFTTPTPKMLRAVKSCYAGKACTPKE